MDVMEEADGRNSLFDKKWKGSSKAKQVYIA